ncbi:MAG TPA: helix-turn-helix transcriptional regulator [Anaerolineae bacterium]|nr:helix-turn-helix transcriptional regulator [Anaerolineae bacterium]HQH37856.1 helix-turn-helix transcriptional regulator [Anaerolineae bacterium]
MPNQEVIELRSRIIGALLQNVRERSRLSPQECAAVLGVPVETLAAYEEGSQAISLPELELLTRFLNVPLSAIRTTDTLNKMQAENKTPKPDIYLLLRNRIVGARLRQLRTEAKRTQQDMADMLECPLTTIAEYELGKRPIPVAELEVVCRALNVPLSYFLDKDSDIGKWHLLQDQFELFKGMTPELREFILKPINKSYLELAMKLAQMPAGALRSIAEGLLEITF